MEIFFTTLSQMGYLFSLIALGFLLAKLKAIHENSSTVLAKLENNLFIPALVLGTFIGNFTLDKITSYLPSLAVCLVITIVMIPLARLFSKLCSKDNYVRNFYIYGFTFPNFGFMGNAVVMAVFPAIFPEYLVYCLPMWAFIYMWGVPTLLIPSEGENKGVAERLKAFVNPMFVSIFVGMALGILFDHFSIALPTFAADVIDVCGSCMSPVAMLLTGITVAKMDFKKTFSDIGIYLSSVLRLVIFPIVTIFVFSLLDFIPESAVICAVCASSMPLGLNTIGVPSAYGKDTSVSTGMALVSHTLSCITIPLMFLLMEKVL